MIRCFKGDKPSLDEMISYIDQSIILNQKWNGAVEKITGDTAMLRSIGEKLKEISIVSPVIGEHQ